MAVAEAVDAAVFKGDAGADGVDSDIAGLQTLAGTEKTLTQANKLTASATLKAFLELVDGKHAGTLGDLRVVSSVGSNVLWGTTVLPAPATTGETVAQFLMRAGLSWRTREGIDANTANGDFGAYIGRQRGIMGAGVAAVWSSGELIRGHVHRRDQGRGQPDLGNLLGLRAAASFQLRAAQICELDFGGGGSTLALEVQRPIQPRARSAGTPDEVLPWPRPATLEG